MIDVSEFIEKSVSPFHAVRELKKHLLKAGFHELHEKKDFLVEKGGKYFVVRDNAALVAFIVPEKTIEKAVVLLSHVDSPCFRIKPQGEYIHENMILRPLEVYGSPIYGSWMNRDLQIAGRIFTENGNKIEEHLVHIEDHPVILAQLALHIDREINTEGVKLSAQEHLHAIMALTEEKRKGSYLEELLRNRVSFSKLLHHELYLVSGESPKYLGGDKNLLAAPRIDNLFSVCASLEAMAGATGSSHTLQMIYCANNEEIGSKSFSGADSPFFSHLFQRIFSHFDPSFDSLQKCLANSFALSLDVAHAFDPKYKDKFEPSHTPLIGRGVTLKIDVGGAYALSSSLIAKIKKLAEDHHIPLQTFLKRGDKRQGSTLGPLFIQNTGIETLDIGVSQLSMHSIREIASKKDYDQSVQLLHRVFKE